MAWDPVQYLRFADHRLRPAADLLGRVGLTAPALVYDLGCGAGNVTGLIAARWPAAAIVGVDSSPEMLDKARIVLPGADWVQADIAAWRPARPADLVFSNAALQWLGDHETLFPAVWDLVAPGGVLAVQMPHNHDSPSHVGIAETVRSGPWRPVLEPLLREHPVVAPAVYWDLLAAVGAAVDVWETEYLHALQGADAVVEWTRGTALKPLLDALAEPDRGRFLADYARRMAAAYPRRADGVTLMGFKRLFIVAQKPDGA